MVYTKDLEPAKLIVGMPSYDGMAADLLIPVMYGMRLPKVQFIFLYGCYIDRNRNEIVRGAFDDMYKDRLGGDFTHLLFLDADTIPMNLDAVEKLLKADKDVISGISTFKNIPSTWMVWDWEDRENLKMKWKHIANPIDPMNIFPEYRDRVIEVDTFGFGFVLVKREVLETLDMPWFKSYNTSDMRYHGEDVMFCKNAQDAGYKIYAHTGVQCLHKMGRFYYPSKTQDVFDDFRKHYHLKLKDEYKKVQQPKPKEQTDNE